MEATTVGFRKYGYYTPITENQMEKTMDNEMETELPDGLMGIQASRLPHLGGVLF